MLFYVSLFSLFVVPGLCDMYTVTDEAWFEVYVKNLEGPGQDFRGRFTIALFGEVAPLTVLNFKSITKGYARAGVSLAYKGSHVHRIVKDFVIQMGDVTNGDGTGGSSIYGDRFDDEDMVLSHRSEGWVSMANHGKDTNNSQFLIMLTKARWLDNKHVVFGKVIRGYDVIETLGEIDYDQDTQVPLKRVRIVNCGLNSLKSPYELTDEQLDMTEDL